MESTNSQSSLNGRAQAQSIGTDAVGDHKLVLLSSLEAHNTGQERLPSYDIGNEVNSMANVAAAISVSWLVRDHQFSV